MKIKNLKLQRNFIALIISLSVLGSTSIFSEQSQAATGLNPTLSEAFVTPQVPGRPNLGLFDITFSDIQNPLRTFSVLLNTESPGMSPVGFNDRPTENPTCSSAEDPKCLDKKFRFSAVIPICDETTQTDCIVEFGALSPEGKVSLGSHVQYLPAKSQNQFRGDSKIGLPSGGGSSIFALPSNPHRAGDKYLVRVMLTGGGSFKDKKVTEDRIEAVVIPVDIQPYEDWWGDKNCVPNCRETGWSAPIAGNSGDNVWGIGSAVPNSKCVENSNNSRQCAVPFGFPEKTSFHLKIRLSQSISGWLHGRISDPAIALNVNGKSQDITLEGFPTSVPVVYKQNEWVNIPKSIQSLYDNDGCRKTPKDCTGGGYGNSSDPTQRTSFRKVDPDNQGGIQELASWLPLVDDKAYANVPNWSVRSLSVNDGATTCFRDSTKLVGLVSTNATQYDPGPPSFDSRVGNLQYKVISPHLTHDGETTLGSYDLLLTSEVARCLYKFSKAPISATIEVVGDDGNTKVATTSFSENNGWVSLHAKNFTFSNPIIRIKLLQQQEPGSSQPSPPVSSNSPAKVATSIPTPNAIKSITCVKGKTTKKISGANPKCPSGYKQK